MTRSFIPANTHDGRGGYVVRRPRATDAIGSSLRDVYRTDNGLPDDIQKLVHRLTFTSLH